jgi:hypothetical protein
LAAPVGAESPPEFRVVGVLGEKAVRSAVRKRQDGVSAVLCLDLRHATRDEIQGLVPCDASERAGAFRPLAHGGIEQTVNAVDALAEPAHLSADEVSS